MIGVNGMRGQMMTRKRPTMPPTMMMSRPTIRRMSLVLKPMNLETSRSRNM